MDAKVVIGSPISCTPTHTVVVGDAAPWLQSCCYVHAASCFVNYRCAPSGMAVQLRLQGSKSQDIVLCGSSEAVIPVESGLSWAGSCKVLVFLLG